MKNIEYYMGLVYTTVLYQSEYTDDTPSWVAEHPALPGCKSDGPTKEDALANLMDARKLYIQTLLELGEPVPEESAWRLRLTYHESLSSQSESTTYQGVIDTNQPGLVNF